MSIKKSYLEKMLETSHLSGSNVDYVDNLYEAYLKDPNAVSDEWQNYFKQLPLVKGAKTEISHEDIREFFLQQAKKPQAATVPAQFEKDRKQAWVMKLISAYRLHGHHHAKLDPLDLAVRRQVPDLDLSYYGFTNADLETVFSTESPLTNNGSPLREIYEALQTTYCDTIGIEYMHITDNEEVTWLQNYIESVRAHPTFNAEQKKKILAQLTAAEGLEKYLGSRFVGQKRFSLEGGDSFIPLMQAMIDRATERQVKEMIIGMAHRGRLNVLVNVLGKEPAMLFQEFEGKPKSDMSGDVKYHQGFSSDVRTANGIIHLGLAFNPSHLEIIGPVVEGSVRSRERRRGDLVEKKQVIPVIVHGDAAFAGQGVVMETFNFSQARGYCTGGTVHIVINNQIGFTTSNPLDSRSTLYCTDVAKMVQAPIIHVNNDDPEAVVFAAQLAMDFRMRFKRDVVIDLVCYRRHGHNEADEPAITQPLMYQKIRQMPTTREIYAEKLLKEGVVTKQYIEDSLLNYRNELDKGEALVECVKEPYEGKNSADWTPFLGKYWREPADTRLPLETLKNLAKRLEKLPEGFALHPVIKRLWEERNKMTQGEAPLNWGYAETLAYATLLEEGYSVRLSGQDSGRGTFAHRQAVVHDANTGQAYVPLEHISSTDFCVIDSTLSEEAVLAFEYGYASAEPNALVLWEAQFGDFVNGAQVVIDQFISSGEQKWGRLCGLVMLLPHGFEGQGPEHSSARMERFLQLCAQHNMQVCVPTTPAQIYHMLRRQMVRQYRKPLIVMTPKSLLRHKLAVSTMDELANGEFQPFINEIDELNAKKVHRIVLCSGKIYYELLEKRREMKCNDIAIMRIEQLYPFPREELHEALKPYKHVQDIVWCQEEPKNQGAWYCSQHNMLDSLWEKQTLRYIGRDHFAAPAVGSHSLHQEQQHAIIDEALASA